MSEILKSVRKKKTETVSGVNKNKNIYILNFPFFIMSLGLFLKCKKFSLKLVRKETLNLNMHKMNFKGNKNNVIFQVENEKGNKSQTHFNLNYKRS